MKKNTKELNYNMNMCPLLEEKIIRNEVNDVIKGYYLLKIQCNADYLNYIFGHNDDSYLIFSVSSDRINIIKEEYNNIDSIEISTNNNKYVLSQRSIETREYGWVYSVLKKEFAKKEEFSNETILTSLSDKRYIFRNDTIDELLNNESTSSNELVYYLLKLKVLEEKIVLKEKSDYYSQFFTYMNYFKNRHTDDIYSSKTIVNNEDVSTKYDFISGNDKLYKIYDLYRGIANDRNIKEINSELLPEKAFDLKRNKGITDQEEIRIGDEKVKTFKIN